MNMHHQERRLRRQRTIDDERDAANAIPFVHAQHLAAVLVGYFFGEQRRAGKWRMATYRHVPFHTATEPRTANRLIGRLNHLVDIEQFAPRRFVDERPESPSEWKQKGRAKYFVLQDRDANVARLPLTGVAILLRVRKTTGIATVSQIAPCRGRHTLVNLNDIGDVTRWMERWQRVDRPQCGGGNPHGFQAEARHRFSSTFGMCRCVFGRCDREVASQLALMRSTNGNRLSAEPVGILDPRIPLEPLDTSPRVTMWANGYSTGVEVSRRKIFWPRACRKRAPRGA